jgi:hypothetical protein
MLAVLAAPGCGTPPPPEPPGITSAVSLSPFNACADLEQYLKDTAVRQMRWQLEGEKPGNWNNYFGFGVAEDGVAPAAAGASGGSSAKAPSAYTTTNVQVKGVDEPDFFKNDGTRIFTLSARTLYATQSWPPQSMAQKGALLMEGYPSSMFLDGDRNRVVVFSDIYLPFEGSSDMGSGGIRGGAPALPCAYDIGIGWGCGWGANATKVTVVDVSRLDAMKVVDEVYLPGGYQNARRIGSSVRAVLSDSFRWPPGVKWWPESNDPTLWSDKARLGAAIDALENDNEVLIRAWPLSKWLPPAQRVVDGKRVDLAYSCGDFYAANAPVRLGLVTVATLDLDNPGAAPARTSIVAEPGTVYASTQALYIASWHWWWWPAIGQQDWFYVHKFDITDPARARYVGSGGVAGHIVDQFSMDEWNGDLRLATTITTRVPDGNNPNNRWGTLQTTNRVVVMGDSGRGLYLAGQSEELAPGERIQSSRFIEDKGYVVTYLQVDPLFTMDLSNRAAPRRVGSLKVPGFSTYIHPLDATHILTMGVYTPDPVNGHTNWNERRMQLQMFDVSNFAAPVQTATVLVGSAYGWSEAAWEHKAFNYFPERGLLAIPFSDYLPQWNPNGNYWDSFVSDVRVFGVDVKTGFTPRGSLSLKDVYRLNGFGDWQWWYSPWIRRSVMATDDQKNDFVYAVADGGLRVANLAAMDSPLATVVFPPPSWK